MAKKKKQWNKGAQNRKGNRQKFSSLVDGDSMFKEIDVDFIPMDPEATTEDKVVEKATKLVDEVVNRIKWYKFKESTITKLIDQVTTSSVKQLSVESTDEKITEVVEEAVYNIAATQLLLISTGNDKDAYLVTCAKEILAMDDFKRSRVNTNVITLKDINKTANAFAKYINSLDKDLKVKKVEDIARKFMIDNKVFVYDPEQLVEASILLGEIMFYVSDLGNKPLSEMAILLTQNVTMETLFFAGDKAKAEKAKAFILNNRAEAKKEEAAYDKVKEEPKQEQPKKEDKKEKVKVEPKREEFTDGNITYKENVGIPSLGISSIFIPRFDKKTS